MRTMAISLAVFFAALVLAQPSPPAEGIQIGNTSLGRDIRFPLAVSQCEPVLIYYNVTDTSDFRHTLFLYQPDNSVFILTLTIPLGRGYLEWICNIPAGHRFVASRDLERYYVVQPGSSFACLRNVTTTYGLADYITTYFYSYTAQPAVTTTPSFLPANAATSTVPFPTGVTSTITVNPDFAIASRTSTDSGSPTQPWTTSSIPPPTTATSPRSKAPAIAGGIVGAMVLLVGIAVLFLCFKKRRRPQLLKEPLDHPITIADPVRNINPMLGPSAPAIMEERTPTPSASTSNQNPPVVPLKPEASVSEKIRFGSVHANSSESSSAQLLPRNPQKSEPVVLTYHPPSPLGAPVQSQSNLAAALDTVSRMDPSSSQPEALMTSLASNTSLSTQPPRTVDTQQIGTASPSATLPGTSELMTALNSISRLDEGERGALVAMLNNVTNSQRSGALVGQDSVAQAPPPYSD